MQPLRLGLVGGAGIEGPCDHKEVPLTKKYIVRLTDAERWVCDEVVSELPGASQKARRARVLLQADADGPAWTDAKICEAFGCRVQTVEGIRQRFVTEGFVTEGFEVVWNGKRREQSPTDPKRDGEGEAQVIALRGGSLRRVMGAGRCGSWPSAWRSWRLSKRSAMKRFARP